MSDYSVSIIDSIAEVGKNPWNNLIKQSTLGSVFHKYEWLKVLQDGLELQAKHILITKDNNPVGIFPHFIISDKKVPFKKLSSIVPGFGGPVIGKDEGIILPLMLKKIPDLCKDSVAVHWIITHDLSYFRYANIFVRDGYQMSHGGCQFHINLKQSYDEIINNMNHHRRKELIKIKKTPFSVYDQKITEETILNFYQDYKTSLEKNNIKAYPTAFFQSLSTEMSDQMKIFTATKNDKPIGSILCIIDKKRQIIHGFFSAITNENFQYKPWVILNDHVIQWGQEHSFQSYDLGETPTDFFDPIFKFKESFGGTLFPLLVWEKSYSLIRWNVFKSARYVYRKFNKKT
jgi:predicted N-acyltransferase